FKQKTAYEIMPSLVGSEMCIRDRDWEVCQWTQLSMGSRAYKSGGVYVPVEQHIRAFADFVLERVG
ncbi:MAG TPA: hypothetical protein DCS90_00370, partial [Ktedonobacter sp.]|nr:hypothetical protein [Ktedonobacter sp.]